MSLGHSELHQWIAGDDFEVYKVDTINFTNAMQNAAWKRSGSVRSESDVIAPGGTKHFEEECKRSDQRSDVPSMSTISVPAVSRNSFWL